uniref:LRRNT domain-containing protein n=1 Tax=Branchiostoma floridae TaxID=7739 RepID=C3XVF5_BRAFL|eukprot:XP_002612072.1 hypothetical protein BRAFLDRAFT_94160 [Branchiostoma floridae]
MELMTSFFIILTLLTTTVGNTVDFTGRNLTHVPMDSFAPNADTVMVVKLSDNKITNLGSFNTTPHIRYLFIDNNKVNNLSPRTFQGLCELRVLNLNRNDIVSLRDFIFSDLTALWNLLLSNNLISAISERAFHGLASLQFLGLAGNRLSVFPAQAIGLIPSKQLLLVSLMVNSISQIPGDIKSAHPSASYQLQGNPLRCPDKQVVREDVINVADIDSWPMITPYVIDTDPELKRSFLTQVFFIKHRHKYFGILPSTYFVTEHLNVVLPLPISPDPQVERYTWNTPTGRHVVWPLTAVLKIEDFRVRHSGRYTSEIVSGTKSYHCDLLLCLDLQPKEEQGTVSPPPSDNFSPRRIENVTDICEGSTNKSCCPYWSIFKPSFHQKFCAIPNSQEKPSVTFIIPTIIVVAILIILFPTALVFLRKREARRENNRPATESTEMESDPNAFPLRRLRSLDSHRTEAKRRSFHCASEALQADTVGTTEAQVHHYDIADASDADEEGLHHSPCATPPHLPVREETAVHTGPEGSSEQPAVQIGNVATGEEIMPYGEAAENSLYQRDSDFSSGTLMASAHASSTSTAAVNPYGIDATVLEEGLYLAAEAHAHADYQRETVTTELYGRQTNHANMTRGISTISQDTEGDFGILYGSGPATAE